MLLLSFLSTLNNGASPAGTSPLTPTIPGLEWSVSGKLDYSVDGKCDYNVGGKLHFNQAAED